VQPSSQPIPHPESFLRDAKKLLKSIKAGDWLAIQRARAVYLDTRDIPLTDVPNLMGLQRCQHVIAKEHGFDSWADLKHSWEHRVQFSGWMSHMNSGHYRVTAKSGLEVVKTLVAAVERDGAPGGVRRIFSDLASFSWEYSAIATRKECGDFIAWSFSILKKANVRIEVEGAVSVHDGSFHFQPIAAEEYASIQQRVDDDPGTDWMPGTDD